MTLGPENANFADRLTARDVNWISAETPVSPFRALAKIRYNAAASPAEVFPLSDRRLSVRFDQKQRAITPGQSVVIYDDNRVIGGGVIE